MFSQLGLACAFVFGISASLPAADPPAAPAHTPKRDRAAELVEKLNASIDDPIQPNGMTVKDYLAKLAKTHRVEIVLDRESFQAEGAPSPEEEKLSFRVPKGARLHTLLGMVSSEIKPNDDSRRDTIRSGVLIRDGRFVVTTRSEVLTSQGIKPAESTEELDWTLLTTVCVIANDEPLSAVLRRVAEVYDVNVVVTSEAVKLAETRITSRILNSPLSTTIQSLADQCGLAVFVRHNIILITSPGQAKKFKQDRDQLEVRRALESKTWIVERSVVEGFGKSAEVLPPVKLVGPLVDEKVTVDVHDAPLRQVISNLTKSGFNITVDPAVGKKADAEVTIKLKDVSCEAAVKQLAELAGLRAVRMDNSLFITTPEKADRFTPTPPTSKPKAKKSKTP